MKFNQALVNLDERTAISYAKSKAESLSVVWERGINFVFNVCLQNPDLAPKFGTKRDNERQAIEKWVQKYYDGFHNRISLRLSNQSNTIPDPMVYTIIEVILNHPGNETIERIKHGHNLAMAAENILGLLLEEYLSIKLEPKGWYCAWGNTILHVDFCSSNGQLLQIKNRSNSENSSSSRVRIQTTIEKWFRSDAISGRDQWAVLNNKLNTNCSESEFAAFVEKTLKQNPKALAIEMNNPWLA